MARCLKCARDFATGETACHTCGLTFPPAQPSATRRSGKPPSLPKKYDVLRFLGRGAMGRVYHCRDARLQVEVAVKVLPADLSDDEEAVEQLTREAQAAAKLRDCEGILTLLSFDEFDENWYLEMEYAPGGSLRDWLRTAGTLPEAECRRIGREVAGALGFAHDRGVLHRDIKPDNVLLDARGRSRVSDFGIARVRSMLSLRGTIPTLAGTPPYMAPEIFQRKPLDGRADLYSLGCMLYELSTGVLPHGGTLEEILMAKTLPGPPPRPPGSVNPLLTEEFSSAVLRLLERDPERRFADGAACLAALTPGAGTSTSMPRPPEAGDLGTTPVIDLVRYFLETRKDGTVEFRVDRAAGTLFFVGGQCVNAVLSMPLGRGQVEKKGEEAFLDLMALNSGSYRLSFERRPTVLSISRPTEALLQESTPAVPVTAPSVATRTTPAAPMLDIRCPRCMGKTRIPLDAVDPKTGKFRCGECGEMSPLALAASGSDSLVGEEITGCRILERIGDGGLVTVYRAMDTNLRRVVAVQTFNDLTEEKVAAAFVAEMIGVAQLNHPNIVAIHKIGKDEKRNLHYLVTEFVEGRSLESIVEEEGPLEPDLAVGYALQVAGALAAAHAKGLFHRNLTPGSLILDARGLVRVTDFGLTKAYQQEENQTKVMGTPPFMAPEMFEGIRPDARCDLYSLGATLYFLLSGHTPYKGATTIQIIHAILTEEPRSLLEARPGTPPELWEILRRFIAKKRDDRPASAEAARAELEGWLRSAGGTRTACPSCGISVKPGKRFCPDCGTRI